MTRIISNFVRLPVAIFVSSCELALRMMREWQHGFSRGVDTIAGGMGAVMEESFRGLDTALTGEITDASTAEKETSMTMDQDLGGDDLKLVRYRILYTKRDHERLLAHGDDLVNYNTTMRDYGGRITCDWIDEHPDEAKKLDSKYIQTYVEVLARYPKQEKEYDRDQLKAQREQVEVLREIRDRI